MSCDSNSVPLGEKVLSVGGQWAGKEGVPRPQQANRLAHIRQHAHYPLGLYPDSPWSLWGINWEIRGPSGTWGPWVILPAVPGPEGSSALKRLPW